VEVPGEQEHRNQVERERHSQAEGEHHILAEQEVDNHLQHHNRFAREVHNCFVAGKGLSEVDIAGQAIQLIEEQQGLGQCCCKDWQVQSRVWFQGQVLAEEADNRQ
jgi:hypothetical protein